MRAVVQRARSAHVTVNDEVVGRLHAPGLVVLVGVTHTDDNASAEAMARKLHGLRILDEERSVADSGAPVLVISQFTLYGDTRRGRRPTWSAAAPAEHAEPIVTHFVETFRALGTHVETGQFRAHMVVALENDGPVTLLVETGG